MQYLKYYSCRYTRLIVTKLRRQGTNMKLKFCSLQFYNATQFSCMTLCQTIPPKSKSCYIQLFFQKKEISTDTFCKAVQCATSKMFSLYVVAKPSTSFLINMYRIYFRKCPGKIVSFNIYPDCMFTEYFQVAPHYFIRTNDLSTPNTSCIICYLTFNKYFIVLFDPLRFLFSLSIFILVLIFSMLLDY